MYNSAYGSSDGKRYLKVKFILVRDNSFDGSGSLQIEPDYNPPPYDIH